MNHDWIDDILAVIDAGSFAAASARRNIPQSAFTRRIRSIEATLGADIFDRRRKPVSLAAAMRPHEPELRRLAAEMGNLRQTLRAATEGSGRALTLTCQHALTATISPALVRRLTGHGWDSVRVRSGNRGECLLQLISGETDNVVTYDDDDGSLEIPPYNALDSITLGTDLLIPLCQPGLLSASPERLPVIAYPPDVFLGRLLEQRLWRQLPAGTHLDKRAETALTLAAQRYALDGIGIAWLPRSLAAEDIAAGRLVRAPAAGPDCPLLIRLLRLPHPQRRVLEQAWSLLQAPVVT